MSKHINNKIIKTLADNLLKNGHTLKSELHYSTHFNFLIAVVLSAQCTDIQVNKVIKNYLSHINSPQDVLDMGFNNLQRAIKSIGLWKAKSIYIYTISQILVDKHNGIVPRERKALESMPGIGRKTANVILNELFSKPVIAVDTHVIRLAKRLSLSTAKTPDKIEQDLYKAISAQYHLIISNVLVIHGRYVCKAVKPLKDSCPLKNLCCQMKKKDKP